MAKFPDYKYDVFISYRTMHRPWVEVLYNNLKAQGYHIFLDYCEVVPGANYTRVIYEALDNSRYAVMVATPDAIESGWVQDEYEYMFNISKQRDDFNYIPIVMGEFPDFPFLNTVLAINFGDSSEQTYRKAFQMLLCALENKPPGPKPYYETNIELPEIEAPAKEAPVLAPNERNLIDSVCGYLDAARPLMVLSQAETNTQHYTHALKTELSSRYNGKKVLHLYPPTSMQADNAAYFGRLAEQCQLPQGEYQSWSWADAMEQRLMNGEEFVLLISGFENGSEKARSELAGELRGLLGNHPYNITLVVMGGKRLASAKYEQGQHSFFNDLEEMRLPSFTIEDIQSMYMRRYPELDLSQEFLLDLLAFSGQHPRIIETALQLLKRKELNWQDKIKEGFLASQLFNKFRNEDDRARLCQLLGQETLGKYDAWPQEALIRELYWSNLLDENDGKFVWRCEFLRESGKEVLGCG